MCVHMLDKQANLKIVFSCCVLILIIHNAELATSASYTLKKTGFYMCGMWIRMCMQHCNIHMFRTHLSPSHLFFLRKPAWTLESDGWIQNFMTRVVNIWIQPTDSHSHQLLHGAIHFVAVAYAVTHMESGSYVYMFSIFTYCVYGIKTTHCLFKWYPQLKAVFIAVYWLGVLGNLTLYLYNESENCYNSSELRWPSGWAPGTWCQLPQVWTP